MSDALNNGLACHLCTDVVVPYFSDDNDMAFGNRPPSLWFQLISGTFDCWTVFDLTLYCG